MARHTKGAGDSAKINGRTHIDTGRVETVPGIYGQALSISTTLHSSSNSTDDLLGRDELSPEGLIQKLASQFPRGGRNCFITVTAKTVQRAISDVVLY